MSTTDGLLTSQDGALREVAGVDAATLRRLLSLVSGTDLEELDIDVADARISLRRRLEEVSASELQSAVSHPSISAQEEVEERPRGIAVTSPLVGYFHPSVKVGDAVTQGQPLGAVEAMGMRTSVDAPRPGVVLEMLSTAGSGVEFGQPLLVLRGDA